MVNSGGWYTWSKTAANNASADNSLTWAEGQPPSSLNDSARALMASAAKGLADISGSIVTTGTSTAYIVSSNQDFDDIDDFNGQMVCFVPHVTNGAGPVTMTVDGFANLPLRSSPNVELPAGVLIQGTPYCVTFNQSDNALYLHGFYGNPYNIPLAAGLDFWGPTAPNSSFAFPMGQAISRTGATAPLFALIGTTYGPGDGSTTFNLPNKTGRVSAMIEATPTLLTSAFFGGNSSLLGAEGGSQSHTLAISEMPSHNHSATSTDSGHTHSYEADDSIQFAFENNGNQGNVPTNNTTGVGFANITTTIGAQGGGAAHAIVQPTIMCNYIMRII